MLRQSPQVLNLQFLDSISRAERDNAIDVYIGEEYMDVLEEGAWQKIFKEKPPVFTREEKREWLDQMDGVTLGSDAFFPFSDCVEIAHEAGIEAVIHPGGSIRDQESIDFCETNRMTMAITGNRHFRH